jgi:predicted kinase
MNTTVVTILIGPPCVGKTSYLKTIDYDFVISSDDIVELLTSRAGKNYHDFFKYPSNSPIRKEHNEIFKQLIIESKSFAHVVWDLTNLTKKARKRIFNHYHQPNFNAVFFDFLGNEKLILERNKLRFKQQDKYVDESVIKSMFLSYEPIDVKEGFSEVTVVKYC